MTWYLTIRSDSAYSEAVATDRVVQFLSNLPELKQSDASGFEGVAGQPWVRVVLANCDDRGNYCEGDWVPKEVRVIELLCSYAGPQDWYEDMALRIAHHVGWSVFKDVEDRQIGPRRS